MAPSHLRSDEAAEMLGVWLAPSGDNKKIIKSDSEKNEILAEEKGFNTYVKVEDSRCQGAIDWWTNHYDKWQHVRNKWTDVYSRNSDLTLEEKVDNKALYKHLFADECKKQKDINEIILKRT